MSKLEPIINNNKRLESPINSSGSSVRSVHDIENRMKKVNELQNFIRNEDEKLNNLNQQNGYENDMYGDLDGITRDEMDDEGDDGEGNYFDNYNDYGYGQGMGYGLEEDEEENRNQNRNNLNNKSLDTLSNKPVVNENLVLEDFDSTNNLNNIQNLNKNVIQIHKSEDPSVESEGIVSSMMSSLRNMFGGGKRVGAVANNEKRGPVRMDAFEENEQKSSFCCFC